MRWWKVENIRVWGVTAPLTYAHIYRELFCYFFRWKWYEIDERQMSRLNPNIFRMQYKNHMPQNVHTHSFFHFQFFSPLNWRKYYIAAWSLSHFLSLSVTYTDHLNGNFHEFFTAHFIFFVLFCKKFISFKWFFQLAHN